MNRRHLPDHKPHAAPRHPAGSHGVPSVALEMQIRSLREAVYRAARAAELAQSHAHSLSETLRCERLRCADLESRLTHLQATAGANAETEAEISSLKAENRRLRSLVGDAGVERSKLMEELRVRSPFDAYDPTAFGQAGSVAG